MRLLCEMQNFLFLVRACPGRLLCAPWRIRASISSRNSGLYGAVVWARRAFKGRLIETAVSGPRSGLARRRSAATSAPTC